MRSEGCNMAVTWKQFEGQIVDDEFPLEQVLASSEHSAVFLTQHGDSQLQKAAIKLIHAEPATAELLLSRWRLAAQLSHPNLLRLLDFGRCCLEDTNFLYVVMEFAEEDLSQILPQRALTPAEARDMLHPVLDVLVYLHGKGLIHGHLKPSHILASSDQLKLSSDTLSSIAEPRAPIARPSPYNAPEAATSGLSTASDVWSLGMTLVEALTQRAPVVSPEAKSDPVIPDALPQPFLDIARHALLHDPKRRWTTAEIAARLSPTAMAATASARSVSSSAVSPLAVPLSSAPALPAAKLQTPRYESPAPQAQSPRQQGTAKPKQTLVLPNYVVPLAGAIFVVVAMIALPKILSHRPESSSSASTAAAQPASPPKPAGQPAHRDTPPPAKPAAPNSLKASAEKKTALTSPPSSHAPARTSSAAAPAPAPAVLRTDTFPSANAPKSSAASPAHGEVLEQVLPDASEKARSTIHGKVRVTVRVHVEPGGNVSQAELDSPGPSKYFADLALQTARRWEFTAPEVNGHSVPSEWLIRFEFSQSGTRAFPRQTAP
jgi:TonB family protein